MYGGKEGQSADKLWSSTWICSAAGNPERADTAEEVAHSRSDPFPDFAAERADDYPALLTIDMVADYLSPASKTMALIDNGSLPVVSGDGEIKVEKAKLEEWLKCTV